jgi:hypothetical protein
LDLFGNISSSSAFIVPTRLQISNLEMFDENRSQYHRLSKYADFDKPRQLVSILAKKAYETLRRTNYQKALL